MARPQLDVSRRNMYGNQLWSWSALIFRERPEITLLSPKSKAIPEINVDNCLSSMSTLSSYFLCKIKHFKGVFIKDFQAHWKNVTGDCQTLQTVAGMPVLSTLVTLDTENNNITSFSSSEVPIIEKESSKLLDKGVIEVTSHEKDELLSPIFLLPKVYGSFRMILNLKRLNESMPYVHFKVETFDKVLKLIRPNCFMCSVDIKDANYSVPISESRQKYLKFQFQDKLYTFVCLMVCVVDNENLLNY